MPAATAQTSGSRSETTRSPGSDGTKAKREGTSGVAPLTTLDWNLIGGWDPSGPDLQSRLLRDAHDPGRRGPARPGGTDRLRPVADERQDRTRRDSGAVGRAIQGQLPRPRVESDASVAEGEPRLQVLQGVREPLHLPGIHTQDLGRYHVLSAG